MLGRAVVGILVAFSFSAHAQDKIALALAGGIVYAAPHSPPIADGIVLIADGKIAAVGPRK